MITLQLTGGTYPLQTKARPMCTLCKCIRAQVCTLLLCEPSFAYGITAHPMYQVPQSNYITDQQCYKL